ncbi:hypothetical protein ZHAS_00014416 [Anopheles sinensis]|uniref:Uncharacterized protein n=1 Tax=Anopheles sinensis TaxID=74873 RepID=A0A084W874_ANOSI|nr:hypothetical protein ZHAS_00014416 [Anopheles sinensis]
MSASSRFFLSLCSEKRIFATDTDAVRCGAISKTFAQEGSNRPFPVQKCTASGRPVTNVRRSAQLRGCYNRLVQSNGRIETVLDRRLLAGQRSAAALLPGNDERSRGVTGGGEALPFPDFGIPGPVANSAKVQSIANFIKTDFANVDEYGVDLTSDFKDLATIRDIMYSISQEVATAGEAIGTAFAALATSTGPSIDTVFGTATSAITSMEALLSQSFTDEFATLEAIIGTYVTTEFRDSFGEMGIALANLRLALGRLKPGIEQAKVASKNSATIAPAIINKYVTPKMIQDVQDTLQRTRSNIQVITYTVTNTLGKLEIADDFIIEITDKVATDITEVETEFENYSTTTLTAVGESSDGAAAALQAGYATETDAIALIQSELDASTDFTDNFAPELTKVDDVLGTQALAALTLDITDAVTAYLDLVGAVDDDVSAFFSDEGCQPVLALVHVLIDNGYYATFCFEKYSPFAFNMFADFVDLVGDCYANELVKFDYLYEAVDPLVQLILFDVEDLAEALTTCVGYPDSSHCFSMIAPLYDKLFALTTAKRDYLKELFMHETDSSVQRFSACYHAQKFSIRQIMHELLANIDACETDGSMA